MFATVLVLAASCLAMPQELKIGIVTDVHYADVDTPGSSRPFRRSLARMREAAAEFAKRKVDFVIELGDFVDVGPATTALDEVRYLAAIRDEFERGAPERHYVLGNHCTWRLTKQQFLRVVGQPAANYSFDTNGIHFVVLDAEFRKDGVAYGAGNYDWGDCDVPPEERQWLADDLARTEFKAVVFVHQRLDVKPGDAWGPASASEVRDILERSHRVLAVFSGHAHLNAYTRINGIDYVTLAAMVDGTKPSDNAYSVLRIRPNGWMKLEGFGHHTESEFAKRKLALGGNRE